MAEDWVATQKEIYQDLVKDGINFSFTRIGKGVYDPVSGEYQPDVSQNFTAPGIFIMVHSAVRYALSWQESSTVELGDKVLLVACGSYDPELEDLVNLSDGIWVIKGVLPLEPGGVALIRNLLIRKS